MSQDDPRRGATFMVMAAAAFSVMGALIKLASATLDTATLVFLRNAFALAFLTPWLLRLRLSGLRTSVPLLHLLRASTGVAGIYLFFVALGRLQLAEAVLLNQTAALFIPFLAWIWLDERPTPLTGAAILVGFVGVALILHPDGRFDRVGALAGLGSGLTSAISMVTIRRNARTEPYARIIFYFFVFATLVSAAPMPWRWQTPGPSAWAMLVAAGALATLGQVAVTRGYASAPAAQVGPWTYVSPIFAALWGWTIWGETPDRAAIAGAVLVFVGGSLTMLRR